MPDLDRRVAELDNYYNSKLKREVLPAPLVHDYSRWGIERYEGWAPPIDWIIEGVLPVTPGLIASMGGVGKSFLMLDAAIRIGQELPDARRGDPYSSWPWCLWAVGNGREGCPTG